MNRQISPRHLVLSLSVALLLMSAAPRRVKGESLLDFKTLYYEEDGDAIKVIAPSVAWQSEWSDGWSIRVEGIYNSISGATPSGAPRVKSAAPAAAPVVVGPVRVAPVIRPDPGDDDEDEGDDKRLRFKRSTPAASVPVSGATFNSLSGATPPPTPTPTPKPKPGKPAPVPVPVATGQEGKIPKVDFDDTRTAANFELSKRLGRHTPTLSLSYSQESDYASKGVAVKDAIDFNKKNTTLMVGVGGTFDDIRPSGKPDDDKTTVDFLVGVTQVLDPVTLLNVSVTVGRTDGYLADPYKVVELNGVLVPEKRPDSKDKQILYGSLTRYFEPLRGSLETSYRFFNDSNGIQSHTLALAWYQKINEHWMVRPLIRYYTQSEADFYGVRFTGTPDEYSSDFRISEMSALGGGLKVIYSPNSRMSFDLSYERYEQWGLDNETPDELYPSANMIMMGVRLWF